MDAVFAELKSNLNKLPTPLRSLINVKSDRVELISAPSECFISAKVARPEQPEAFAGFTKHRARMAGVVCC